MSWLGRSTIHWLALLLLATMPTRGAALDLSHASISTPPGADPLIQKSARFLREEVQKRSAIEWPIHARSASDSSPSIVLKVTPESGEEMSEIGQEGYRIYAVTTNGVPTVYVIGKQPRGVLFGVGRLLRSMDLRPGKITLPDPFQVKSSPRYPLRGHQLGYRPKTNSYDAWDLDQWEQYIRDLIIFGCNAIELIPPRSDDAATSPHFPRPPLEMMKGMSQLAADYGLDVWIWYPAMDPDYANPKTVDFALREWAGVFRALPKINAVFVPGGDPGHTEPRILMQLLERQTTNLHGFHPKAEMWMSPQSFTADWYRTWLNQLQQQKPTWLKGVVHGPQVPVDLEAFRSEIPSQYPIRNYPDITHSRQCQFPVPDWDTAFALTEARECINPRPTDERAILQHILPPSIGFISYSEGCNDDVNKAVWSALAWDPDQSIETILLEFSRYFIGAPYADRFAHGLLSLEQNWKGPLATHPHVEATLADFQALEREATPVVLANWRFQQALFRAYYDAYTQQRLLHERRAETAALDRLKRANQAGAAEKELHAALTEAEQILKAAAKNPPSGPLRQRILQLGDALNRSIHMQLSVKKHKAIAIDRGAMLDTLDYPLNDRPWLTEQFAAIRKLPNLAEKQQRVSDILGWKNPGPGGFYDDLGDAAQSPHWLRSVPYADDPGSMRSPRVGFEEDLVLDDDEQPQGARRWSWKNHAESLFDSPLEMRYDSLDPKASYRIRVVYGGDSPKKRIRLAANDGIEIHGWIEKPFPFRPVEFAIPKTATQSRTLTLHWYREPGLGGNGRGCQVSEVWLLKQE